MNTFFSFFKEKIFDFDRFFNWTYLTISPSENLRHSLFYLIICGILIVCGLMLSFHMSRVTRPRFYKKFIKLVYSFLIYPPILMFVHFGLRYVGIEPFNNRLTALTILAIWLIWFIFLLYYLIVRLPKMFGLYELNKRKEKFIKNGSKN